MLAYPAIKASHCSVYSFYPYLSLGILNSPILHKIWKCNVLWYYPNCNCWYMEKKIITFSIGRAAAIFFLWYYSSFITKYISAWKYFLSSNLVMLSMKLIMAGVLLPRIARCHSCQYTGWNRVGVMGYVTAAPVLVPWCCQDVTLVTIVSPGLPPGSPGTHKLSLCALITTNSTSSHLP